MPADHMENLYLSIRKLTSTKFDSRGLAEGVFHHDAVQGSEYREFYESSVSRILLHLEETPVNDLNSQQDIDPDTKAVRSGVMCTRRSFTSPFTVKSLARHECI